MPRAGRAEDMEYHGNDVERLRLELKLLTDLAKTLTSTLDLSEVLRIIMGKVSELLRPKNWSLLLMEPDDANLRFEVAVGDGADALRGSLLKVGEGVAGWVARTGESVLIEDVHKDPRFCRRFDDLSSFTTRSIVCVPMKNRGRVLGVIELINKIEEGTFSDLDMRALETVAEYAAIAIDNAASFKKIQRLVITDEHTSLYNVRYLHEALDREIELAREQGHEVSMLFFDLDRFKKVNDTHGHLCGSKVLREVGFLVRKLARAGHIPVRYGGDEFIILMPRVGKEEALEFANHLRDQVSRFAFLAEEGLNLHLTASYGLAAFPRDARDKVGLMSVADSAMYRIKESGRDGIATA
jgi:diguanylate cyclase (GGDEF)-like protein